MLTSKSYLKITKIIFFIVGLAHLSRLLMGWNVILGDWIVPQWVSIFGTAVAWYIAYNAFTLLKKK